MERWLLISLLLSGFGAIKEFRPSEPFITHYLMGPQKNFTESEVNQQIFPVETYSRLVELIVVFLVTDLLRYKPIIIVEGIAGMVTWALLIWGKTVLSMQVMESFFGLFIATEVAYYTYIYAQVDREHYQKVTSHTRAAFLFGRCMTGVVSQILISFNIMDYYQLNFISFAAVTIATVWAFFLPPAKSSIYFHRESSSSVTLESETTTEETGLRRQIRKDKLSFIGRCKTAYYYLWRDFKTAYRNMHVLKWSFWWAVATCGYVQVLIYVQLIWEKIIAENHSSGNYELYNGAVESLYTILGAVMSLACGCMQIKWEVAGDIVLAVTSFLEAVLLFGLTWTNSMVLAYFCFIVFGVIYNTMITVANAEVAKHVSEDSYGLIFGVNTFFSLAPQTILTAVAVVSMDLPIRTQFRVYGGYFAAVGAIYLFIAIYHLCAKTSQTSRQQEIQTDEESLPDHTKQN